MQRRIFVITPYRFKTFQIGFLFRSWGLIGGLWLWDSGASKFTNVTRCSIDCHLSWWPGGWNLRECCMSFLRPFLMFIMHMLDIKVPTYQMSSCLDLVTSRKKRRCCDSRQTVHKGHPKIWVSVISLHLHFLYTSHFSFVKYCSKHLVILCQTSLSVIFGALLNMSSISCAFHPIGFVSNLLAFLSFWSCHNYLGWFEVSVITSVLT